MNELQGATAIVTGGASGIGAATVRALVGRAATVAIFDLDEPGARDLADELSASGAQVVAYGVDVAHAGQVGDAVERVSAAFGAPSLLVNGAALLGEEASILDTSHAAWQRSLDVTLTGCFNCAKAVLPAMVERRHGAIVNISSVGAQSCFPNAAAYCVAKAGVVQLGRSLAVDYGKYGVRTNTLLVGSVDTPGLRMSWNEDPEYTTLRQISLLDRIAQPEEIASAVCWLASPEASFVCGATVPVDGGWTAH